MFVYPIGLRPDRRGGGRFVSGVSVFVFLFLRFGRASLSPLCFSSINTAILVSCFPIVLIFVEYRYLYFVFRDI